MGRGCWPRQCPGMWEVWCITAALQCSVDVLYVWKLMLWRKRVLNANFGCQRNEPVSTTYLLYLFQVVELHRIMDEQHRQMAEMSKVPVEGKKQPLPSDELSLKVGSLTFPGGRSSQGETLEVYTTCISF